MHLTTWVSKAQALFAEASFIVEINNDQDYEKALSLMDELIEDYDNNRAVITLLAHSIKSWEDNAPEFAAFNRRIEKLDSGIAVLKTLMDQQGLKADDLKSEIGSKSLVSMVLNGSRNLTREHIQALSERFGLSPAIFFDSRSTRFALAS